MMILQNEKKKSKHKKKLAKLQKINKKKYQTRKEQRRKEIPQQLLVMLFDNDEQIDMFVQELLTIEDDIQSERTTSLLTNAGQEAYNEKLTSLKTKECKSPDELVYRYKKIKKLERKSEKKLIGTSKDLSLISIMNPSTYSKKFISIPEYRKELKRIAHREKEEMEMAVANGFLSFDINEYEKRIAQNMKDDDFIYKSQVY